MQKTIDRSMDVWDDCAACQFLAQMGDGTLDRQKFLAYIVQDSLYLRDYLKCFAYAITKAQNLQEMQLYYELLGYVNDGENQTRLNYLKDLNMTDAQVDRAPKRPQCRAYCDFLMDTCRAGDQEDILMAILPCMLGYRYVFEALKRHSPRVAQGYFGPLVSDYTSEAYAACCQKWTAIANARCGQLDPARQARLMDIFRQASLHELYFWQMAGEGA